MTAVAYLGLGGNLGDTRQFFKDAVVCLAQHAGICITRKSSLYRTQAIDGDGPDYLNAVLEVHTHLNAEQLLRCCQQIEQHFGRERPYINAPRTLDLDVLLYNAETICLPDLHIPHPRMHQRAFVLVPLLELCETIDIPGRGLAADFLPHVGDQRIEKIATCHCPCPHPLPPSA